MIQTLIILTTLLLPQAGSLPPPLAPPSTTSTNGGGTPPANSLTSPPPLSSLGSSGTSPSPVLPSGSVDASDPEYQDNVRRKIKTAGQVIKDPVSGIEDLYAVVVQLPPEAISMLQAGQSGYKVNIPLPADVIDYASILTVQVGLGDLRHDPVPDSIRQKRDLVKSSQLRVNSTPMVAQLGNQSAGGLSDIDIRTAANQYGPTSTSGGLTSSAGVQPALPPPVTNTGVPSSNSGVSGLGTSRDGFTDTSSTSSGTSRSSGSAAPSLGAPNYMANPSSANPVQLPPPQTSFPSESSAPGLTSNGQSNASGNAGLSGLNNGMNAGRNSNQSYTTDNTYNSYGSANRSPSDGQRATNSAGPEARVSQNAANDQSRGGAPAGNNTNYGAMNQSGSYQDPQTPYSNGGYNNPQYQNPMPVQPQVVAGGGALLVPYQQYYTMGPQIAALNTAAVPAIGRDEPLRTGGSNAEEKTLTEAASHSGDDSGSRFLPIITLILLAINIYQFFWMTHVRTRYKEMVISKRNAQISMSNS